jgi:hypothetical protein
MMEWMPYGQTVNEFRAHVRTFADVFPHALIAFGPAGNGVYMLGSNEPLELGDDGVRALLARDGVLGDLNSAADAPVSTLDAWATLLRGLTWIQGNAVEAFAGDAPLILDDHPSTEYFLLRRLLGPGSPRMNEKDLRAATPPG